nr:MAG TPA: Peptidase [Caudoviricetes sp.]
MPNTVLGKVSCTPKGDYNEGAAYVVLDIVAYGGGSYMALKGVQGITPSNDGVNWMQLAAPGEKGDKGDTGNTGPQGKQGEQGQKGDKGDPGNTGPQGDPGAAAGFGTPTATVDESTGAPSVKVTASGPDTAKVFSFAFTGLKGETGSQGGKGDKGDPGTSVSRIERTSGNGAPGTTDTYTMYDSEDAPIGTFTVYNGMDGIGSGDMLKSVYDPQNKNADIFDYVDKAVEDVTITTDATPTQGSKNPVQSGGVYSALQDVEEGIPTKVSDLTNDSGFISGYTETDPTVPEWAKAPSKPTYTATEVGARPNTWMPSATDVGAIPASQKGAASGVAELDSSGKVPSVQLPSYVDDVVEFASRDSFPATGEDGKIYIAEDTNLTYRWSGTQYVEISPSLALGETSSTAYRGDRGKTAYDHSQTTGNPHGTTAAEVGARPDTWMPKAADVGARPSTWTPSASDVGAVPTTRKVNGKALSADISLSASDVGAATAEQVNALKPKTATVTLTAAGWTQSGDRYSQSVSCAIVKTDSPIVLIDAALSGTDLDADAEILNAWAGPSAQKTEQGDGTLTFYSVEVPTVNIPVSVGVIG